MRIARLFRFEAAHALSHHDGKCRRLHGHSYRLWLTFEGVPRPLKSGDPQSGFVVDFGRLQEIIQQELIDPFLDHHMLHEHISDLPYSSSECLSAWIVAWCVRHLEEKHRPELGEIRICSARLQETENAWAEADREDAVRMGFLDGCGS